MDFHLIPSHAVVSICKFDNYLAKASLTLEQLFSGVIWSNLRFLRPL